MKKYIILFILFSATYAFSAPPSRQNTYVSGDLIEAADVTANEDALFNYLTKGVDTYEDNTIVNADINASANIQSDKLNLTAISQAVGITSGGSFTNGGATVLNGAVTIGDAIGDTLTIDAGAWTLTNATTWTLTGALTFSGTIADLGIVTTADINGGTLDGVQIGGTTATGELIVNDSSDNADGLGSQGTSGQLLKSQGTGSNPIWATQFNYYEPSSTVVLAVDNGTSLFDLSGHQNVLTMTSLSELDLVSGKVSEQCYNYDGSNDYVVVTLNSLWNAMEKFTLELWFYKDTTGTMHLMDDASGTDLFITVTNTNLRMKIDLSGGALDIDQAHGLASNGTGAWVYLTVTWNGSTLTFYLNGSALGTTGSSSGSTQNIGNLYIGSLGTGGAEKWNGRIDGLRILRHTVWDATTISNRYDFFK